MSIMVTEGDPNNHNSKMKLLIILSWELGYVISVTAVTGNKREANKETQSCIIMLQEVTDIIRFIRI